MNTSNALIKFYNCNTLHSLLNITLNVLEQPSRIRSFSFHYKRLKSDVCSSTLSIMSNVYNSLMISVPSIIIFRLILTKQIEWTLTIRVSTTELKHTILNVGKHVLYDA